MKDYELSEFDEDKLPKVSLNEDQLKKISSSINITLSDSLMANKDLDIDTSFENIISVYESLGEERDKVIHGLKYAKVIQELVITAFDKKYSPNKSELIYKNFFYIGNKSSDISFPPTWVENQFYVQIYITKTHVILYYFNYIFKMVESYTLPISDIENVSLNNDYNKDNILDYYLNLYIKSKKYPSFRSTNILNTNSDNLEEINKLRNTLISLGISNKKENSNKKLTSGVIIVFIFIILTILITITQSI